MANKDAAFGLRPAKRVSGSPFNGGQSRYRITTSATAYSTKIYMGDIVTQGTGGTITRIARADGGGATSAIILGVFNGCYYTDPTTSKPTWSNHWPGNAATDAVGFIIDDPYVVFEVQADAAMPVADLFGNFDIVYTSAGRTVTGISGAELQVTDGGTATTLSVKAIDISTDPENSDVATANTNVLVVIQNHIFGVKGAGLA